MKNRKTVRFRAAACAVCVVCTSVLAQTFPSLAYTNSDGVYDAAKTATLEDQVLEYGELWDLINEYNPTMVLKNMDYYSQITSYEEVKKQLDQSRQEIESAADDLKKEGDAETAKLYMDNVKSLRQSVTGINKSIDNLEEEKSTKSLVRQVNALTAAAQSLMNSYNQFKAKRASTEKKLQLQESVYQDTQAKASLGLVTELEVSQAKKNLETAQHSLKTLDDSIDSARRNLCLMTGWSYDATPDIQGIPEPDMNVIAAMDLSVDKERAVNNNYDVQSQRHSVGKKINKEQKSARRSTDEAEQEKSITFEDLYSDVQTKKLEYEAACTAYESAVQDYNGLQAKKQMGMLSNTEYLQGEADYLEKEADKKVASMSLYQAMETYQWAVEGLISTSAS